MKKIVAAFAVLLLAGCTSSSAKEPTSSTTSPPGTPTKTSTSKKITFGAEPQDVAAKLGCDNIGPVKTKADDSPGTMDIGNYRGYVECDLEGVEVGVMTFDSPTDQASIKMGLQMFSGFLPAGTYRYAEGQGWAVLNDDYSEAVADLAVKRLGGSKAEITSSG